ncbi:Uncharacterized protein ACO02O_01320 [Dirofilaria immitis]
MLLSSFARDAHAIVCIYMGERHNHGDRWVVRSAFIIECHVYPDGSWRAEVVACQTPKGIEMNDGDEVVEDDMKLQCRKLPYGVYQMQKHDIIRNINCEGHSLGEWWISKRNFNKTCTSTGIHVVNCLTDTGIPLRLNISIMLNGTRYNCTGHSNGVVTLTREFPRNFQITSKRNPIYYRRKTEFKNTIYCTANGMQKQIGETWIEDTNFLVPPTILLSISIRNLRVMIKHTLAAEAVMGMFYLKLFQLLPQHHPSLIQFEVKQIALFGNNKISGIRQMN